MLAYMVLLPSDSGGKVHTVLNLILELEPVARRFGGPFRKLDSRAVMVGQRPG
jgi:hypothetical protein